MTEVGSTSPDTAGARRKLLERLTARGWTFSFFQAVWLLERMPGDQEPVGGRGPVAEERLRFRPDAGLAFPSTDVYQITRHQDPVSDKIFYQLDVTFMGLYGVATPLPLHYAVDILRSVEPGGDVEERVARRAGEPGELSSTPARDFLDVLHHRLISLFYRAWTKYRYHVTFGSGEQDVMSAYLLWLIGCLPGWSSRELGVDPIRMIRYAGLLTQRPKSAAALEGLLFDYWDGIPVEVEQCVGRWVALRCDELNRIGCDHCRLGADLTVGEQVYDLNGRFDMVMGPMDWQTYTSFLPDGTKFAQTEALVGLYRQDPLGFGVTVKLRAGEVPEMKLCSDEQAGRLGYTSWARTDDVAETAVTFEAASAYPRRTPDEVPAGSA